MTASALPASETASRVRRGASRLRAWLQPQVSIGAREQRDQAVLLLAVAVVVAPHFEHLPMWSIASIGAMWIWRAALMQTLKPAPGRIVMAALLSLGTVAIWLQHGTLFGRDASVNLLLILMGLKVLEMRAHRDVLVIVFLSLFVLQTEFLYDESLFAAAIMAVSVALLFFVLLSVNLPEGDISFTGKLRYLARVFVLALPTTFALFFLFPRLPAPAWHVGPGQEQSGTGLSGSMTPGSLRLLLRNDAVALRARFERGVPRQKDLYWRGPVFGLFDGRTWSPANLPAPAPGYGGELKFVPGSGIDYTVTLEPTQRRELIAIELAAEIDGVPTALSRLTQTLELQTAAPVSARLRYRAHSYTSFSAGPIVDDGSLAPWLQLPEDYNPRTLQWAAALKARVRNARSGAAGATPLPLERRLVDAVLAQFHDDPYRYSLKTPLLGRNSVDEFLFDTRVGYCEHYSSAFVVLMRAMGIPARVVTGYQGGEVNPIDGYLTVRQSDAHAWAEVWLANRGWLRVDPTAAVAPERVEQSLHERNNAALEEGGRGWSWLNTWRMNREALENAWNQWFLSYSAERQRALIARMGLRPSIENVSLVALAVIAVLLLALTIGALRQRTTREPLAELVFQLRAKLARAGVSVPANMGLRDMEELLTVELEAGSQTETRHLLGQIAIARYARNDLDGRAAQIRALRAGLRRWRPVRAKP